MRVTSLSLPHPGRYSINPSTNFRNDAATDADNQAANDEDPRTPEVIAHPDRGHRAEEAADVVDGGYDTEGISW